MVDRHVWLRTLMLIGAILVLPACAAGPGQTTATPSAQAIQPATEAKAPPPSPTPEATRVALSLTATPTGTWHTYRDPSYGFSLQYPPDWRQSIAFSQPYSKSILRRIEITYFNRERGDNAEIAIDIRPAYGDLLEWFQDELRTNAGALYLDPTHIEDGADSVTAYNAQLAGRPAIFVYEPEHNSGSPDMAQVYVADGEYFLVFTYWGDIPDNLENRATYLRALETVQFTGSATQGLALPETAFVAGVVTAPQIPNGSTVAGYVIAGYGAHRPIGDLPLWVGLESIGDPVTRTLSDGYFAIGDLPPGRVNIVDSHLAFQAFIPGMGARIDLGRLKYPLSHLPTY